MGWGQCQIAFLFFILIKKRSGFACLSIHCDAHLPCVFAVLGASIQIVDGQEEGRALMLAEILSPEEDRSILQ